MAQIGFILVVMAFLGGALLASLDPRAIRWEIYLPVLLTGFIGVGFASRARKQHARSEHVLQANRNHIEDSLTRLIGNLEELEANKDRMAPHEFVEEIDRRCRDDLRRFADARESLAHIYGLQHYADIMTDFAAGERYVNRVWSASADGYLEEAQTYLTRALAQFRDAKAKLDRVHESHEARRGAR